MTLVLTAVLNNSFYLIIISDNIKHMKNPILPISNEVQQAVANVPTEDWKLDHVVAVSGDSCGAYLTGPYGLKVYIHTYKWTSGTIYRNDIEIGEWQDKWGIRLNIFKELFSKNYDSTWVKKHALTYKFEDMIAEAAAKDREERKQKKQDTIKELLHEQHT